MPLSEMEALAAVTDYRLRRYLKGLIDLKKKINVELQEKELSVQREMELRASLEILDQNLQKIRFSGILF